MILKPNTDTVSPMSDPNYQQGQNNGGVSAEERLFFMTQTQSKISNALQNGILNQDNPRVKKLQASLGEQLAKVHLEHFELLGASFTSINPDNAKSYNYLIDLVNQSRANGSFSPLSADQEDAIKCALLLLLEGNSLPKETAEELSTSDFLNPLAGAYKMGRQPARIRETPKISTDMEICPHILGKVAVDKQVNVLFKGNSHANTKDTSIGFSFSANEPLSFADLAIGATVIKLAKKTQAKVAQIKAAKNDPLLNIFSPGISYVSIVKSHWPKAKNPESIVPVVKDVINRLRSSSITNVNIEKAIKDGRILPQFSAKQSNPILDCDDALVVTELAGVREKGKKATSLKQVEGIIVNGSFFYDLIDSSLARIKDIDPVLRPSKLPYSAMAEDIFVKMYLRLYVVADSGLSGKMEVKSFFTESLSQDKNRQRLCRKYIGMIIDHWKEHGISIEVEEKPHISKSKKPTLVSFTIKRPNIDQNGNIIDLQTEEGKLLSRTILRDIARGMA